MESKGTLLTSNEEAVIGQYYDRLLCVKKDVTLCTATMDFDNVRHETIDTLVNIILDFFVPRIKEEEKNIAFEESVAKIKEFREKTRFLQNLEEKFQSVGSGKKLKKELFEKAPLSLREFIQSSDHMNFTILTEKQYAPMELLLGNDVEGIWDSGNYMSIPGFGRGSGKDTISVIISAI